MDNSATVSLTNKNVYFKHGAFHHLHLQYRSVTRKSVRASSSLDPKHAKYMRANCSIRRKADNVIPKKEESNKMPFIISI